MYSNPQQSSFTEKLVQYFSLFGIAPWYSIQHHRIVYRKTFKWYSIILATSAICLSLALLHLRFSLVFERTFPKISSAVIELTALAKFVTAALGAGFWNMSVWEEFLRQSNFIMKEVRHTSRNFARNEKVVFMVGNMFIAILYIIEVAIFWDQAIICLYFTTNFIYMYTGFLMVSLILNTSISMRCGYQHVNDQIMSLKFGRKSYNNSIETLKKAKRFFLLLDEFVDNFNRLMGWCLLLTLFEEVFGILGGILYTIQLNIRRTDETYDIGEPNVVINVSFIAASTIWLTAIIFCCDSAVRKAEKLLISCHRLEQTLPLLSKEVEELDSLKNLIKYNCPKLTAAGFFDIRRSTLLALLSTTTTYFIVLLQFKSL